MPEPSCRRSIPSDASTIGRGSIGGTFGARFRIGKLPPILATPARGRSAARSPRRDRLLGDPQYQAATAAQASVVLRPVRHRVAHLREVVAAVGVLLVGLGGWAGGLYLGKTILPARRRHPCTNAAPRRAIHPAPRARCNSRRQNAAVDPKRGRYVCRPFMSTTFTGIALRT